MFFGLRLFPNRGSEFRFALGTTSSRVSERILALTAERVNTTRTRPYCRFGYEVAIHKRSSSVAGCRMREMSGRNPGNRVVKLRMFRESKKSSPPLLEAGVGNQGNPTTGSQPWVAGGPDGRTFEVLFIMMLLPADDTWVGPTMLVALFVMTDPSSTTVAGALALIPWPLCDKAQF